MWDIWLWPMVFVTVIMLGIGIAGVGKMSRAFQLNEKDRIPNVVAKHPFTMNPLLWIIIIASVFIFIIIFYYWASFY
ncbi:hypothetical protein CSV75_07130 [Sporosarcina sp. P18a]|uniref:hypothetical protein n=1 Tax=unclassified Sporosarcina TaxID=2647733 RepID=UPI000C173787|nr:MULTISPECIES: hypothetical protein [unclassified Sporosarcina]PIC81537.1 hypothetical protein CSV75_07130 [Sporosarcina sp. P18a]PID01320.1 hypothetical protein CSV67_14895 [Sporosarcina sp. P2]PID25900.1 hypothetical protein CSV60_00410 [Sporosarcina sp. P7]